jgi:hypothetical protein
MAGNELVASFPWTDNQLTCLSFSRNDNPIAFTQHEIDLTFKDPRGNGEIEKILLDPQYRPGNASNLTSGSKQPSPHQYPIRK